MAWVKWKATQKQNEKYQVDFCSFEDVFAFDLIMPQEETISSEPRSTHEQQPTRSEQLYYYFNSFIDIKPSAVGQNTWAWLTFETIGILVEIEIRMQHCFIRDKIRIMEHFSPISTHRLSLTHQYWSWSSKSTNKHLFST